MNTDISKKWDATYLNNRQDNYLEADPCKVLKDFPHLLPKQGRALDLACGLAANAFFLSSLGLKVDAVDISPVAIDIINKAAQQKNLNVSGIIRDIETDGLPNNHYEVIVVSNFLDRYLMPQIIDHLEKGGVLFYQTWIRNKVTKIGPQNPKFLLKQGELLEHFRELTILHYREEGKVGDPSNGFRNQASIIAIR